MLARPGKDRLQIGEVEQQQLVLVGMAKDDLQHALLRVVEAEQPGEQQRPHLRDRGADRVALLAVQIPEDHRIVGIGVLVPAQLGRARFQLFGVLEGG